MKRIMTVIAALILIISTGYCLGEERFFSIQSDKQAYKTGEQMVFTLKYKNTSKEDTKISIYDIEHKLKEGLNFVYQGSPVATFRLIDYTKRKLPVFSASEHMFTLKPQEEYKVTLVIDSVIPTDSSWRFIEENNKAPKWNEGLQSLPAAGYKVFALNAGQPEEKTNTISIEVIAEQDVLSRRYGEFSTAGAFILVCISNKESGKTAEIVCENTEWYDILTKETAYFKGNEKEYLDFMLKNHDKCFELSALAFDKLAKELSVPKNEVFEKDKNKGIKFVAEKYLKKNSWSPSNYDYIIRDKRFEHDRGLLRMLLESGLVVRRDCESGQRFIEAKEVDAAQK